MTTGLEQSIIRLLGSHMAPPDLLDLSLGNDSFSAAILTNLLLDHVLFVQKHSIHNRNMVATWI